MGMCRKGANWLAMTNPKYSYAENGAHSSFSFGFFFRNLAIIRFVSSHISLIRLYQSMCCRCGLLQKWLERAFAIRAAHFSRNAFYWSISEIACVASALCALWTMHTKPSLSIEWAKEWQLKFPLPLLENGKPSKLIRSVWRISLKISHHHT